MKKQLLFFTLLCSATSTLMPAEENTFQPVIRQHLEQEREKTAAEVNSLAEELKERMETKSTRLKILPIPTILSDGFVVVTSAKEIKEIERYLIRKELLDEMCNCIDNQDSAATEVEHMNHHLQCLRQIDDRIEKSDSEDKTIEKDEFDDITKKINGHLGIRLYNPK